MTQIGTQLSASIDTNSTIEDLDFARPEKRLPPFDNRAEDLQLLATLMDWLSDRTEHASFQPERLDQQFESTNFPHKFKRISLYLYAPGQSRILITRPAKTRQLSFGKVFSRLLRHPRRKKLTAGPFHLQMDFVVTSPQPVDYLAIGMVQREERHFELGVDGLLISGPDKRVHLFSPGDAYVRSIMGMKQLRRFLAQVHGQEYLERSSFARFQTLSYLSSDYGWRSLYRGLPVRGELTRADMEESVLLAIDHIKRTQEPDGRFLYYYDAASDSRRDHEHPERDPKLNPYYNILRHSGGGLTCLFYEKCFHHQDARPQARKAIEYLISQFRFQEYAGREGAYVYSERKSKLGGAGLGLYLIAEYELVSGDTRYRAYADKLAWHLLHQITESGEFLYYNT